MSNHRFPEISIPGTHVAREIPLRPSPPYSSCHSLCQYLLSAGDLPRVLVERGAALLLIEFHGFT